MKSTLIKLMATLTIAGGLTYTMTSASQAQVAMGDYFFTSGSASCPINTHSCDVTMASFPADKFTDLTLISCRVLTTVPLVRMEVLPQSYVGKVTAMPLMVPSYFSSLNESSLDQRLYVVEAPIDFKLIKGDKLTIYIAFSANIPHLQSSTRCTVSGRLSTN